MVPFLLARILVNIIFIIIQLGRITTSGKTLKHNICHIREQYVTFYATYLKGIT